jgi:myo-inositol 2-dehydrogenase / D-chiro-inositol 1-dehydrogenase
MIRRDFIKKSLLGSAGIIALPAIVPSSVFGKNAPSNRINIGVIGCGAHSRKVDMFQLINNDAARVVALCDVDSKRLAEGKEMVDYLYSKKGMKQDTLAYGNYLEMLGRNDIDAILICTPDHWHAKPVIDAAYAGKDIFVEVPFSCTLEEGRLMSNAVKETGQILQAGIQERSMEQFRVACELIRNGRIGQLKTIRIGLLNDNEGIERPEMPVPPNLNYDMWLGSTPYVYYTEMRVHPQVGYGYAGWYRCEPYCLGNISSMGIHLFDIIHWAMDTELSGPTRVSGTAVFPEKGIWNVHGKIDLQLKYDNGVEVEINNENPLGLRFEGTEGWIFVNRGNYFPEMSRKNPQQEDMVLQASSSSVLEPLKDSDIHLYKVESQLSNWLNCIRDRKPTISPAEVTHRSNSVSIISHIAMKTGRKLKWDPKKEKFIGDEAANAMLSRRQRAPYQIKS